MSKIETPADLTLPTGKVEGQIAWRSSSSIIKFTIAVLVGRGGGRSGQCTTDQSRPQIKANAILRRWPAPSPSAAHGNYKVKAIYLLPNLANGVWAAMAVGCIRCVWPTDCACRHIFGQLDDDGQPYAIIRKYSAPSGGQPWWTVVLRLTFYVCVWVCVRWNISVLMPSNVADKCSCLSLDTDEC